MIIPPWVYGASALLAISGGFYAGWTVQGWRYEAAQSKALQKAAKDLQKASQDIEAISARYEQEKADALTEAYNQQDTIRTIFRDRPVDTNCAAPDDARRVLEESIRRVNVRITGQSEAEVPRTSNASPAAD